MSKLLSILMAAGFTCAVSGVLAQDVTSEGQRAQGQEKLMQQKEEGTQPKQSGARERPTFAPEFLARFAVAQRQRRDRIEARVVARLAELRATPGAARDDA